MSQSFFLPSQMSQIKLSSSLQESPTNPDTASSILASEEESLNVKREFSLKYESSDIKVEYTSDTSSADPKPTDPSGENQEFDPLQLCQSSKKYGTFTKEEKQVILDFLRLNGVSATLEKFGPTDPRVTRRKLRNWLLNIGKPKNVKGKKTNDPDRNEALFEWMREFKDKFARPPTRRELRQKALEVSNDRLFIASKGWVDKFTKKFKVDLTPIKNIR